MIRAIIEEEDASGWARMRRVPSTSASRNIDYVSKLDPARRRSLLDAFAWNALYMFDPSRDPHLFNSTPGHEEYQKFRDALPLMFSWDYLDVRTLRAILGERGSGGPFRAYADAPDSVIQRAESIRPIKATDIRRVVKQVFRKRFGASAEDLGGGDWRYVANYSGRTFDVSIDYGGNFRQFSYEVQYDDEPTGLHPRRLTYERMLGIDHGSWNYLTADNLAESIEFLCQMLEELVTLPDRLNTS